MTKRMNNEQINRVEIGPHQVNNVRHNDSKKRKTKTTLIIKRLGLSKKEKLHIQKNSIRPCANTQSNSPRTNTLWSHCS